MDSTKLELALNKLTQIATRLIDLDDRQDRIEARTGNIIAKTDFLPALLAAAAAPEELGAAGTLGLAASGAISAAGNLAEGVNNTLNSVASNAEPHETTSDSVRPDPRDKNGPTRDDPFPPSAPTRVLWDSADDSGLGDRLEQIWQVIESLTDTLGAIARRLDGIEARADSMSLNAAVDPIGEREYRRPVHS